MTKNCKYIIKKDFNYTVIKYLVQFLNNVAKI